MIMFSRFNRYYFVAGFAMLAFLAPFGVARETENEIPPQRRIAPLLRTGVRYRFRVDSYRPNHKTVSDWMECMFSIQDHYEKHGVYHARLKISDISSSRREFEEVGSSLENETWSIALDKFGALKNVDLNSVTSKSAKNDLFVGLLQQFLRTAFVDFEPARNSFFPRWEYTLPSPDVFTGEKGRGFKRGLERDETYRCHLVDLLNLDGNPCSIFVGKKIKPESRTKESRVLIVYDHRERLVKRIRYTEQFQSTARPEYRRINSFLVELMDAPALSEKQLNDPMLFTEPDPEAEATEADNANAPQPSEVQPPEEPDTPDVKESQHSSNLEEQPDIYANDPVLQDLLKIYKPSHPKVIQRMRKLDQANESTKP